MGASDGAQSPNEAFEKVTTPSKLQGGDKSRCTPNVIGKTLIGVGVFVVILGILYGTVLPKVIDDKVQSGVVTCSAKDGAKDKFVDQYGDCKDCTPYYYNLHMFNVTNAEAHLANNEKLQLQEVGPYVYRRRQIRVDVAFENERVSYKQYTYHTYEAELSCSGCSDRDTVVGYNVGYMSTIAQAGGERAFLTRLALGSFAKTNQTGLADTIRANEVQMMKWVNGLNSFDPAALKTVSPKVLNFLLTGPSTIEDLVLEGFSYNGVFASRTISQWALGFPSMLAGIGLASNYNNVCVAGGLNAKCAACVGNEGSADCLRIWNECKKCKSGERVVALNPVACAALTEVYASKYGATEAAAWAKGTCGLCSSSIPLCAAPLPGIIEKSGLDFTKTPPASSTLRTYIMRTGCDDKNHINEYEQYDGYKSTALWTKIDPKRNPTLAQIIAFQTYGNCANPTANLSCSVVIGNDATSLKPGGVSITGFEKDLDQATTNIYLLQAFQNVTLFNQHKEVKYKDITLHRFSASKDLLTLSPSNEWLGTGTPYSGVQPLAFTSNFLAYLSYPVFMYGDKTLLEGFDLTMLDGVVAKQETLYESGELKPEYLDRFETYIDVEAGTGKTMRARKRLQASYALSYSLANASVVMSDVLWPNLKAEVIVPAYFGEESATITSKRIDSYKTIRSILRSMIPVLVVGIVVGLILVAGGIFYRRRRVASSKTDGEV